MGADPAGARDAWLGDHSALTHVAPHSISSPLARLRSGFARHLDSVFFSLKLSPPHLRVLWVVLSCGDIAAGRISTALGFQVPRTNTASRSRFAHLETQSTD
jgi:hypothetical protein